MVGLLNVTITRTVTVQWLLQYRTSAKKSLALWSYCLLQCVGVLVICLQGSTAIALLSIQSCKHGYHIVQNRQQGMEVLYSAPPGKSTWWHHCTVHSCLRVKEPKFQEAESSPNVFLWVSSIPEGYLPPFSCWEKTRGGEGYIARGCHFICWVFQNWNQKIMISKNCVWLSLSKRTITWFQWFKGQNSKQYLLSNDGPHTFEIIFTLDHPSLRILTTL